jgi:hypothetical protein
MDYPTAYEQMMAAEDPLETIRDLFPKPRARQAFKAWVQEQKPRPSTLTKDKFINEIDHANFFDQTFLDTMVPSMSALLRPWFPVGHNDKTYYRVTVEPFGLLAQDDESCNGLFPRCILSFRLPHKPDFVFFQLGELEYTTDAPTSSRRYWRETGFYAVAKIGAEGGLAGVFVIYKMVTEDEEGRRGYVDKDCWGLMPNSDVDPFFCARLGARLGDLSEQHYLDWERNVVYDTWVDLVAVPRVGVC